MKIQEKLTDIGKYMQENHLAWGTSGNISSRLDENNMMITASGTYMGNLKKEDFVTLNIRSGEVIGKGKASKETFMHTGVFAKRPDVQAVLHSSPFYSTFFACSDVELYSTLFVETMYYLENISYVDYHHPGSKELADAVAKESAYSDVIILRNHGVVVCDDSLEEASMRLETLELACRMLLEAKQAGISLQKIPEHTAKSFLEEGKYKSRKKMKK